MQGEDRQEDVPLGCIAGNDGLDPAHTRASPDPADEPEGEESMDVESLGGIGRMFGAVISRFAQIPIPTQISHEVIRTAKDICTSGALDGIGAADDRLCDLVWGWEFEGKVERQAACFFRVTVNERQASNGILISCRSYSKGKFKLLMFDSNGEVVHHEDSMKSTAVGASGRSEATLYFTPFETYKLGDAVPEALREEDIPPVLGKLDSFHPSRLPIEKGQHLICVYGDNFLGKTSFTIVAVPSLNECPDVAVMKELDQKVMAKQEQMSQLREEFLEARAKFHALSRLVKEETVVVDDLVANREAAYINYLESSVREYQPMDNDDAQMRGDDSPVASRGSWMDGVSSGVTAGGGLLFSGLQGGLQQAPSTASAATGWLAASFTTGFDKINKMMGSSRSRSTSEDHEAAHHHEAAPRPDSRPAIHPEISAIASTKDSDKVPKTSVEPTVRDPSIAHPVNASPPLAEPPAIAQEDVKPARHDFDDETDMDPTTGTLIHSSEIPDGVARTGSGGRGLEDLPAVLMPPRTPPRKKTTDAEVASGDRALSRVSPSPLHKPALPGSGNSPDLAI